jgi:uncharacterized membrane protein
MTDYMIYGLIAYMIGVVVSLFDANIGRVTSVIGAVLFVLAWLLTKIS